MKKRNYRPIRLADSLQGINNSLVNKFGRMDYVIRSKWANIVGTFFVQYSKPDKITIIPKPSEDGEIERQEKILHVNVAPAASVEFQHFQNKILEKINSFFGYQAIHQIKIHQKFFPDNVQTAKNQFEDIDQNLLGKKIVEIKDTIQQINDKELEQSLLNLGLSIAKNDKN